MNGPKYTIGADGLLYHVAGGYALPDDEPVMILRGKDPIALAAIEEYIRRHPDYAHRISASERYAAFLAYQTAHPERVNTTYAAPDQDERGVPPIEE